MSDVNPIRPVSAVNGAAPTRRVQASGGREAQLVVLRDASGIAATTGGSLRPATAQLVVDPDTHAAVIRITDATTDQLIGEHTAREVDSMTDDLQRYVAAAARRRAGKWG